MPNTFHALKSRRVEEALDSVRRHVRIAIQQTRMEPVGISVQELKKAPLPSLPEVTNIQPGKIPYEDRDNTDITVTGKNLDGVHAMHLIRREEVEPWSTLTKKIEHSLDASGKPDGKSLKAHFDNLGSAPPGSFNLLLIDNDAQTTLSVDAVTIYPPAEGGGQASGLQLGGIFPNGSKEDTTIPAIVVVLKGEPTEFCVTDLDGNEQSDWSVEMVAKEAWGSRFGWKPNYVNTHMADVQKLFPKKVGLVLLIIEIPEGLVKAGECRQIFRVVGKSAKPKAEDALAFFVRRELKQTY